MEGSLTTVEAPAAARTDEAEFGYRSHLDGLRAVAVYLVVAFHAGIEPFAGGFIGVDVFFVLSGYLVTQVLRRDLRQHGTIRLRRFYARRVRRLLPAAALTLVVTAAVYSVVASPAAVAEAREAITACALYVANWFFLAGSTDYFGADVSSSPVLHFWSLAVEEQFYLLWPLLFSGLVVATRRAGTPRWALVRAVVAVGALASAVGAAVIATTDLDRAYYGTDTRAYQLLAGALLALSPGAIAAVRRIPGASRVLPAIAVAGVLALPVLSLTLLDVGPITRGMATTVTMVALLCSLEATRSGFAARALSAAPIVYLGRISYGTYLWHWPVIVIIGEVVPLSSRPLFLITVLVATGVASLSYQLMELPIRRWKALDRRALTVVAVGLLASVLVALVAVPRILPPEGSSSTALAGPAEGVGGVDPATINRQRVYYDFDKSWECGDPVPASCTVVDGAGLHVLVMGDSHANALVPTLTEVAQERGLRLSAAVRPVCPWQLGLQYNAGPRALECEEVKAEWYSSVLPDLDPDIVIVANRPIDDPTNPADLVDDDRGLLKPGTPEMTAAVEARSRAAIDDMVADGRRVLVMEPIPSPPKGEDPLDCLTEADEVAQCRFVAPTAPSPMERAYRDIASEDEGVWSVDMDQLACPYLPICDPVIGDTVVRRDDIHLTVSYAQAIGEAFGTYLDDNSLIG